MKFIKYFIITGIMLAIFVIFTIVVKNYDVKPIGPEESLVGFSTINADFHNHTGVNLVLYYIVDWASILTVPLGGIFFTIGLVELIRRKNIMTVDANILALGLFYVFTGASYLFFQLKVINYRPVLFDGKLESSYPSSTTVLALNLIITAIDQIWIYLKNKKLKISLTIVAIAYAAFLIVGRIFSGVHWFTDLVGSVILSGAIIPSYFGFKGLLSLQKHDKNSN